MWVTQTILERPKDNMLKWCGYVIHMEDNRWPNRMMIQSTEGR